MNQIWAGHPGSQVLANIGSNGQVEVWTKPLGGGRTAVLVVNTAKDAEAVNDAVVEDVYKSESMAGNLQLVQCNHSRPSQMWVFSPGVVPASGAVTNVFPADAASLNASKGEQCWSVHACRTSPGSQIALDPGCKKLPEPPFNPCPKVCDCNCAWEFYSNKTIASAMTGQCLTAAVSHSKSEASGGVQLEECRANEAKDAATGGINATQQWIVTKRQLPLPRHAAAAGSSDDSIAYSIESAAQPGMCVLDAYS